MEGLPEEGSTLQVQNRSIFQPRSGKMFSRQQAGLGRIYQLLWNARDLATKHTLQQWEEQYRQDYFTLADWERGRYFTGRFDSSLTYNPRGNQSYDIKARFTELAGLPMFAYPTNWARDAVFLEERNSAGEDLVKLLTPANWTFNVLPNGHGGAYYSSNVTNATAEWQYFGYGFQFWSATGTGGGIVEVTCTRVRDGSIASGPTNVDLYAAVPANSAALLTVTNLGLDFYRVKLRVTGTKNAASTDFLCLADAIQVMR
jgi:hypothetical protein